MAYCGIKRRKDGGIDRVVTRDGNASVLFDKIASIPFVGATENALGIYKNVLSEKFTGLFGKWYNHVPVNRKDLNAVVSKLRDYVDEETLKKASYAAGTMQKPKVVVSVGKKYSGS
jgi:hypothetical protein